MSVETQCLCALRDVNVTEENTVLLDDFQYDIEESVLETFISQDGSASALLQVIAGRHELTSGEVLYRGQESDKRLARWIQYVPDDIICYTNMTVKEFLWGVSLALVVENVYEEAIRLCELFEIELDEELLNLTFEQNRLVAMIQAIVARPKLLLLDHPYDMIGRKRYGLLLKELVKLKTKGTTILIAANAYEEVVLPCNRYIFLKDGLIHAQFGREELPKLSKVIMIENGNPAVMRKDRMRMLYRTKTRWCFLYREDNVAELVLRIYQTGCSNFTVNELSMEEEVYGDYERWQL